MPSTTAGNRRWPFARSSGQQDGVDVLAMRYDEEAAADELASWCDGQVVVTETVEGELVRTIYVPTRKGPRPAVPGDWIVRQPDGSCRTCSPVEFAARCVPQA